MKYNKFLVIISCFLLIVAVGLVFISMNLNKESMKTIVNLNTPQIKSCFNNEIYNNNTCIVNERDDVCYEKIWNECVDNYDRENSKEEK